MWRGFLLIPLLSCIPLAATAFTPTSSRSIIASCPSRRSHPPLVSLLAVKEASFGMGCFWAPSERLLETEGVIDTVVGYTGNPKAQSAPTYDNVCFSRDWVEGVRVTYDDSKLSYKELLDAFFEAQEPKLGSRQYASIIFPHSKEQELVAQGWLQQEPRTRNDGVSTTMTSLEPLSTFYQAEGYHQRYWQKMRPRIVTMVALLAASTGALDPIVPVEYHGAVHTAANGIVLLGCIYVLLERVLDTKVIEL